MSDRETVEGILAGHADENASCERLHNYHVDGGACTPQAMLHALRTDTRLVLYLHTEFSVIQIASGGDIDGEARYATYWYNLMAEELENRSPELWTMEPRREVADVLEQRYPRVIHIEDSELVSERSPWHRSEDKVGRVQAGPEARP